MRQIESTHFCCKRTHRYKLQTQTLTRTRRHTFLSSALQLYIAFENLLTTTAKISAYFYLNMYKQSGRPYDAQRCYDDGFAEAIGASISFCTLWLFMYFFFFGFGFLHFPYMLEAYRIFGCCFVGVPVNIYIFCLFVCPFMFCFWFDGTLVTNYYLKL